MKNNFVVLVSLVLAVSAFGQAPDTTFLSIRQEEGVLYDLQDGLAEPSSFLSELQVGFAS